MCAVPQAPARRLWNTVRHEASWGVVGSTYWLSWSSGFASRPAPRTFLIESISSVLRKAAKSPVAAGSVQDKSITRVYLIRFVGNTIDRAARGGTRHGRHLHRYSVPAPAFRQRAG